MNEISQPHPQASWAQRAERGFTLVECLVALVVLGIALVSSIGVLTQHRVIHRRLDAHIATLRSMEAQAEAIRGGFDLDLGGVGAIASPPVEIKPVLHPGDAVDEFMMTYSIRRASASDLFGLYVITLETRYRVGGAQERRDMHFRIWRP